MPRCARSGSRCSRPTSTSRSSRTSSRASASGPSAHDVLESLNAGQQVVKIVNDELVALLSAGDRTFHLSGNPAVVAMVGLQGSGKTTSTAKLARHVVKHGRRPLLVAADPYRPAAADQLETLGRSLDIPVYRAPVGTSVVDIARQGVARYSIPGQPQRACRLLSKADQRRNGRCMMN